MSNIELSTFIYTTIDEILLGVKTSRKKAINSVVAPALINGKLLHDEQSIQFEVFTETKITGEDKITISVMSGFVGGDGSIGGDKTNYQKIAFSVPVCFRGL
jgi:hypothetical protein